MPKLWFFYHLHILSYTVSWCSYTLLMQKTVISFMNNLGSTKCKMKSWERKDATFSDLSCSEHKNKCYSQQCIQQLAL